MKKCVKNNENDIYNFFEFIEQYEDVWNDTQQKFLGIGVAIKKIFNMFNQYVSKNKYHKESFIFFSSKIGVLNEKRYIIKYNKTIFYYHNNK